MLDVDGVLTDGSVIIHPDGEESKRFNIKDGAAIAWSLSHGLDVALLSARESRATAERARQLGITLVRQGVGDKGSAWSEMIALSKLAEDEVAYMGDDLIDVRVLRRAGLAGAPADAAPETRAAAHWVSSHDGGRGAVRDFLELILKVQGRWAAIVDEFSA